MFAPAVRRPRLILPLAVALAALAGCGQQRQDANEPEGSFRVDVVDASFPAQQHIAQQATMRIAVRNPDRKTVPDVAVTVETQGRGRGAEITSFGQSSTDPRLSDPNRPVWVVDQEPKGGTSAYTNTWSLGPLPGGQTKTFEWKVTPVQAGSYAIAYRVAPGLNGKARVAAGSKAGGAFRVTVADQPVPARVDASGNVVHGEQAGAGKD